MFKSIYTLLTLAVISLLAGCTNYKNVPPNDIAMILTPTGYEEKVYTPGQVDIGELGHTGQGNRLVLLQRSGVEVKEGFTNTANEGNTDKEDHRCLTADKAPVTLDVRLLFAIPDYETSQGKRDLSRIFLLGNPTAVDDTHERVLRISADKIYAEQAQQAVRGKIRQIAVRYRNFDHIFNAFGDEGESGLTKQLEHAVAAVLVERNIPLRLVSAYPSNLKPDPTVIDAIAALQAAEKRIMAIRKVTDFLDQDASGSRRLVYQMQTWQEIVNKATTNGHNTIGFLPAGLLGGR